MKIIILSDQDLQEVTGGHSAFLPVNLFRWVESAVSNALKTRHDTVKNSIGNIR